jgi:hypothetical protein
MVRNIGFQMAQEKVNLKRQANFAFYFYYFSPCVTRLLHDGRTSM